MLANRAHAQEGKPLVLAFLDLDVCDLPPQWAADEPSEPRDGSKCQSPSPFHAQDCFQRAEPGDDGAES